MTDKSGFLMWGERGLVATFFADIVQSGNSTAYEAFLKAIEIDNPEFPRTADEFMVIIEPDFSNTGFGHPDAVIRIGNSEGSYVFILEAKRQNYFKSCRFPKERISQGFNSTLNGQLELDYALALALEQFQSSDTILIEPKWISDTPYKADREKLPLKRRLLKNPSVLREVASNFCGLPRERYFYIAMTTDSSNPFSQTQNKPFLPELYHEEHGLQNNCWSEFSSQFGWINYERMESIIKEFLQKGFLTKHSLFLNSLKLNLSNMSRVSKVIDSMRSDDGKTSDSSFYDESNNIGRGVSLIYAPEVNTQTFLHFSWSGESCAIRDYSISGTIQPFEDRSYRTSDIRKCIKFETKIPKRKPVWDVKYWHEQINVANNGYLKKKE